MPVTDLLLQGLELMGLGMSIVFGFLVLLVFVMHGMSRLAGKLGGGTDVAHRQEPVVAGEHVAPEILVAVISAAIDRYRSRSGYR
jgi:oxaloacetate decarboxylase gamma subunit